MRNGRRGFGLIEFTIIAIPVMFLTVSIVEAALESWQFHSMAYAVEVATRYACNHGRTCTKNGNTCTITVGNVATLIKQQGPSLDPATLNVTLTTANAAVTCNPLNSCLSNAAQFPSTIDNGVGLDITITATYQIRNPLPFLWPGSTASSGGTFTLGAKSRQNIVY